MQARPKFLRLAGGIFLSELPEPFETRITGLLQITAAARISEDIVACPGFPLLVPLP